MLTNSPCGNLYFTPQVRAEEDNVCFIAEFIGSKYMCRTVCINYIKLRFACIHGHNISHDESVVV